jgi:hypothetical protein
VDNVGGRSTFSTVTTKGLCSVTVNLKADSLDMAHENAVAKKAPRAWDALTPPLAEWILDAVNSMGYPQATPVQKATFDFFRGNKDVVVEVRARLFASSTWKDHY